jgi:hypothetical protein
MASGGMQVCPVCGVKIIIIGGGDAVQKQLRDRVLFSTGAPGTRSDLWRGNCIPPSFYPLNPVLLQKRQGASPCHEG